MTDRRSRCTQPRATPLDWRDYRDESHADAVEMERWLNSLPPLVRDQVVASIDSLMEQGAEGEIPWDPKAAQSSTALLKPLTIDPDIYELRIKIRKKLIRIYFAEPSRLPGVLVELHRHIKTDDQSQVAALGYAALRYRAGERDDWES